MSSSALIVGAAPAADAEDFYRQLLAEAAFVIACDAAGEWCVALGRTPDLAVGDFDSAEEGAAARLEALGCEVVLYPAAKDESDLDIALTQARARGFANVILTAAYSERLDHSLAAIGTLLRASDLGGTIEEPDFTAYLAEATRSPVLEFTARPGATVSVLGLVHSTGVTLTGLVFPLVDATLPLLSSLGLSNVVGPAGVVRVALASGTVLVIASRGEVD